MSNLKFQGSEFESQPFEMSEHTEPVFYYLIPDAYKKDFSLTPLLRSIKRGQGWRHIRKRWIRKHKAIGGVKVMYQHCQMLRERGFKAELVVLGKYRGNFFGFDITPLSPAQLERRLRPNDVLVCPELIPYLGLKFDSCKRVLFVQNWRHIYRHLEPGDEHSSYVDLGYDYVLSCSNYISKLLSREPSDRVQQVTNFIDLSRFHPEPAKRINGRIMALPRKNPRDLAAIMAILHAEGFEFELIDGVSEAEIINAYQRADVFLATGYPEGFGLPPLEAMACGAAVVGFTGGGADEFMFHEETALVAEDGDIESAVTHLRRILEDTALKERVREAGTRKARHYHQNASCEQLVAFRRLFDERAIDMAHE
ncbi:glycosyltransferase family 4 protein [Microbulbifer bruguierae]|uniref:Glycosyltransferase family 4 protein n=1 Tax=Microbulbifer bruguierae TaxID=3029061 RepID=A0ABY8NFP3_9GAMM|nr:glycosyltransferase family 4 protein [Microbulbifer bruguierae]WGL17753.1 glycosyltransferase family 4 protein [Microbulbifer bruguierae]